MRRKGLNLENYLYQATRVKHPEYDVLYIMGDTFLEKVFKLLKRAS